MSTTLTTDAWLQLAVASLRELVKDYPESPGTPYDLDDMQYEAYMDGYDAAIKSAQFTLSETRYPITRFRYLSRFGDLSDERLVVVTGAKAGTYGTLLTGWELDGEDDLSFKSFYPDRMFDIKPADKNNGNDWWLGMLPPREEL